MSLIRHAERCLANQTKYSALNAFVSFPKDVSSIQRAVKIADERTINGTSKSEIDGRLIAVKDNICTSDLPTTCSSNILKGFTSPYPATVVEKLVSAGAIVTGKTNLDEFGMGSHSTNSIYGAVKNSVSDYTDLSAGGSSGGSAVAVATGQCWAALGTDTGGSVRLPAAYTGTFGYKPSYGVVSRYGVVAYANSLDTVGVIASNTRAAYSLFSAVRGYDSNDPTSLPISIRHKIEGREQPQMAKKHLRIGVPLEYNLAELEPIVRDTWLGALLALKRNGHSIQIVSLPATKLALSAYYILAPAESSSNLAKYDGVRYGNPGTGKDAPGNVLYASTRGEGLGPEVRRRILLGAYSLSASAMDNYFIQAQKVRRLIQKDYDNVFAVANPLTTSESVSESDEGVDILLSPTAPSTPPELLSLASRSPVDSYRDDVLTVPVSLAGLPAMSVPVRISSFDSQTEANGIKSIGLQITAQYGNDELVFSAAQIMEDLGITL